MPSRSDGGRADQSRTSASGPATLVVTFFAGLLAALGSSSWAQEPCGAVGDRAIHACRYEGEAPTVVLAAGAGQDSRTWAPLLDELTALASVVTFDRPGLGRSPDAEGPRTPTAIAREMRALLESLEIAGPVVLVGHSMGGVHALRYADLYPRSVAGVLLLDTPPPGFEQERLGLLSPSERDLRREALERGRARARPVVGRERDGAASERWEFERFPSTRPLLVVVADSQDFGDLGSPRAHRELWARLSERWLELSSRGELVVAEGSGHMIHHDRPRLVLDLLRRLLVSARSDR